MAGENPGGCPPKFRGKRGPERSARRLAAEAAGLSRHQLRTALSIGAIPLERFEELVEGENPPTVTALAEMGRAISSGWRGQPAEHPRAMEVKALARRVARLVRLRASPDRLSAECTAIAQELVALSSPDTDMEI